MVEMKSCSRCKFMLCEGLCFEKGINEDPTILVNDINKDYCVKWEYRELNKEEIMELNK